MKKIPFGVILLTFCLLPAVALAQVTIDDHIASVPSMSDLGMIVFTVFAGAGSLYYLRKRPK